jgi:hypothetical protein
MGTRSSFRLLAALLRLQAREVQPDAELARLERSFVLRWGRNNFFAFDDDPPIHIHPP